MKYLPATTLVLTYAAGPDIFKLELKKPAPQKKSGR